MPIELNHTIVPARDKVEAARFFADLFGLEVGPEAGPFALVRVNDALTLDFDEADVFVGHHYGFLVDDDTFDAILARAKSAGIRLGAGVAEGWNGEINRLNGGRGVYFEEPNGHSYEIFTRA
jgi:catechol 2,3-dioxygenase-like lactoylglutathione lyase family enzyme